MPAKTRAQETALTLPKDWQLQRYEGSANGKNQYTQNRIASVTRGDQVRQLCVAASSPFDGGKKRRVWLMVLPEQTRKAIAAHLSEHSERCRTGLRLPVAKRNEIPDTPDQDSQAVGVRTPKEKCPPVPAIENTGAASPHGDPGSTGIIP